MVHVLDRQVELIFVPLGIAAILGSAVSQHATEPEVVFVVERQHAIVHQIGGGDRRLAVIKLRECDLGVGVDEGLLIDSPDPFHVADVECVLRAAVAWALALELAMGFLLRLGAFERLHLGLGEHQAPCAILDSKAFSRCFMVVRSWRCQTQRTPAGEIDRPCLASSLATRSWPQAGWSTAIATTAASMSGAVRFFRSEER